MSEPHPQKIICFDFDGVLCEDQYADIGTPKTEMIDLMNKLALQGYYIIVNSARRSLDYDRIRLFLEGNGAYYNQLCLGSKPVADLYIDDKGLFADPRILEMVIERHFENGRSYMDGIARERFNSPFVLNMRDIPEVGGGTKSDNHFAIGLAMTGGMDSTTMWLMLEESGLPYLPIYFDMGQSYAKAEVAAIREITGRDPSIIFCPMPFVEHKHILSGRNAIILLRMAELITRGGGWGEIWFGNLAGESPILGGDKSRRFFNDMTALLAFRGLDARIVTPLIGMDKTDEVNYWKVRGDIDTLKKTKTCFSEEMGQCGRCQACFLKWVAFVSAGVDCSDIFPDTNGFEEHVKKYTRVMGEAHEKQDFSHYSPSRIKHTLTAINLWNQERGHYV